MNLITLARATVHPARVLDPEARTYCQCPICWRVEQALRLVAAESRTAAEAACAVAVLDLEAQQAIAAAGAIALVSALTRVALDAAVVAIWRGLAVIERSDATTPRAITPAMRSVHNHRALVYDACATDLSALK